MDSGVENGAASAAPSDIADGRCIGCDARMRLNPTMDWACDRCRQRLPAALIKAAGDYFDYAARLVTGEIIFFMGAEIHGEWVHLSDIDELHPGEDALPRSPIRGDRGIDVRISSIVWIADAPFGS